MKFLRASLALTTAFVLASSAAVLAQGTDVPGGFKHDASQPIKISADELEVRQNEQVAVFTGSVDARQGTVRMQAQRLIVTYDPDSKNESEAGAIKSVRAEGDVFISSEANTASGNWADYNVAGATILMGDTVTLTQGENVIGGNSLQINLNTGEAKLKGGVTGTGSTTGSGRVEMILNPAQKN